MGCTATATPEVRDDIRAQLRMEDPLVLVTGFDRPNLALKGKGFSDAEVRDHHFYGYCRKILGEHEAVPSVIIYCTARTECERVAAQLNKETGMDLAEFYHADMEPADRADVQDRFQTGKTPWIVATIAFGMGIDKPDIRYVLHHTIPGSVESYYQEVGRAGRDGKQSFCNLFYTDKDVSTREYFIRGAAPTRLVFEEVYHCLMQRCPPGMSKKATYETIVQTIYGNGWNESLQRQQGKTALTLLKHAGAFTAPGRGYVQIPRQPIPFNKLQIDYAGIQDKCRRDLARLAKVQDLIDAQDKKQFILRYFGEIV